MDKADTLFEKPGKINTGQTLQSARDRAETLGINEIVIASTTGDTAYQALEILEGFRLVAVTYHCGFREPFQKAMERSVKNDLEAKGVRVIEATHALSGVERSIAKKYTGSYPVLLVADTLRLFGHGTKVAVEITVMAADGGALCGNDIIAIGGSSRGADTACVIKPAHQSNFFDLRIREIICKPRNF